MPTVAKVYRPVVRARRGPYHAAALVGVNTVVLGWNVEPAVDRSDLLGFGVKRTRRQVASGDVLEVGWLNGQKRFERAEGDDEGAEVPSDRGPFQRFRWSDYAVEPEYSYDYEIFPVRGTPEAHVFETPVRLHIRPSEADDGALGVFVNRGVTAAQAYLSRFAGRAPDEVPGDAAYHWLSRGLKESLLGFINASGTGDALHVAIYEFHDRDVAQALRAAKDRGTELRIVYHAPDPTEKTVIESERELRAVGIKSTARGRTDINISHNKFVVRLHNGAAHSLWTGSANFSEAGFNLQTNFGLVIRDPAVIAVYEAYHQVLRGNPPRGRPSANVRFVQDEVEDVLATSPATFAGHPCSILFSPVRRDHVLDVAIDLVQRARSVALISAPFALDKTIVAALDGNSETIVEYGLANATAKKKIAALNRRNTRFFTPTRLETYMGRAWDAKAFGSHKIHAKSIVVDPWGSNPKVLLGSANFSDESCRNNDENALLVEGDQRLAAIVATEFVRMFDHYKSRSFINQFFAGTIGEEQFLARDGSWANVYFNAASPSHKFRDREVFSGRK